MGTPANAGVFVCVKHNSAKLEGLLYGHPGRLNIMLTT